MNQLLIKRERIVVALLMLTLLYSGCTTNAVKNEKSDITAVVPKEKPAAAFINDEEDFTAFFEHFKQQVKNNQAAQLPGLLNFPFYTGNEETETSMGKPSGEIEQSAFGQYRTAIFNADVLRLIPEFPADSLVEINKHPDELYYQTLQKVTDLGSTLYEAYLQYQETGTQAESFFGFVFGRVNGNYKAIAYYGKWPVK